MEQDERRKQQLHEIKLQEAAAKANQSIGHKEQMQQVKLKDGTSSLLKPPKMNRQKLGLPSTNPMAGTEMFKQGQRSLPRNTDTVPAMLTPGEAVIPQPAAQDPKNKKAIKRMVKEGRKANKLRDGAVDVQYSDAPGQAKYHANGTTQVVPSLAYEHPDVPGSSFMNGTTQVFSRGSSDQANYADGTYGVVPQQVQQAVGYYDGAIEVPSLDDERFRNLNANPVANFDPNATYDFSKEIPQAGAGVEVASADDYYNSLGSQYGVSDVVPVNKATDAKREVVLPNSDYYNSLVAEYNVPAVPPKATVVEVPKPADIAASNKPVVAPGTSQKQRVVVARPTPPLAGELSFNPAKDSQAANVPAVEDFSFNAAKDSQAANVPLPENVAEEVTPVLNPVAIQTASDALRSREDSIKSYMKMQGYDPDQPKDTKGFLETFKDALSYSGVKDALGLNNQEIARMATMAIGGRALGYNFNRSLAYAGKNMFLEASKRSAQESADKKAAMRNSVTMAQQDIRNEQLDLKEKNRNEQLDKRAAAKEVHDRFIANQQTKMADLKEQYRRDGDAAKFERQLQIMNQQQQAMDRRMQATMGNQWNMMYAREAMRENSPGAALKRMEEHVDKAAGAVSQIYDRDLGSADIKGNLNPARTGLPTPKQSTQQAFSYLKRAGFDVSDIGTSQEANSLINQATEQMIADKKSNRVSSVPDIGPYLARNVVTHRMGLDTKMFEVGNKPMPPEKITDIYGLARRAATDSKGNVDQAKVSASVNAIATAWNAPEGKKYRDEFKGTANETAFAQFLKNRLEKQLK
jgi:hypothetical protein